MSSINLLLLYYIYTTLWYQKDLVGPLFHYLLAHLSWKLNDAIRWTAAVDGASFCPGRSINKNNIVQYSLPYHIVMCPLTVYVLSSPTLQYHVMNAIQLLQCTTFIVVITISIVQISLVILVCTYIVCYAMCMYTTTTLLYHVLYYPTLFCPRAKSICLSIETNIVQLYCYTVVQHSVEQRKCGYLCYLILTTMQYITIIYSVLSIDASIDG